MFLLSVIMPSSMLGLTDSLIEICKQKNFASMVFVLQIVSHNAINVGTSLLILAFAVEGALISLISPL